MPTIDDLLAQSLLLRRPHVPCDVIPYDELAYAGLLPDEDLPQWGDDGPGPADEGAAQCLTALCEAVVAHCTADQFADFLTDQLPQPRAAWILGCVLQLAGAEDGARFWWQYAAGADGAPASYCLYLQHLSRGDTHAAALWHAQADVHDAQDDQTHPGQDAPAYRMVTADTSLSTVLRILSLLNHTAPRRHTPAARAVIEFVDAAVAIGYDRHPDLEIPLPGTHFAEQLNVILAATSGSGENPPHPAPSGESTEALPNRSPQDSASEPVPARERPQGPKQLLVEVTSEEHEPATVRGLFEAAVPVCWETAIAATTVDGRGSRMTYYLNRFRTRAALALSSAPVRRGTRTPSGVATSGIPGL
ncbi:hypothetical protein J7I94_11080 [Streptomyces sp. ISL-12]|uniref:hypothetical protein n=1 Tax=Streptomyces sp. ISL-12 TaxID=2819177 RepID=UPI001BEA3C9D|nr:hypothetical protein [Streptomyces sp. ISL-12]MBT2411102.1 hypothetical protein [Streptomyces sp. ISL-12]